MSQSRFLKGTMILSGAIFVSKFLGMLFVIPFEMLVDSEGALLYSYAYTPYTIILSIATVGIPLAVSKYVSKYNAIGEFHKSRRLFKSGMALMGITGVIGFLLLYFAAPWLAESYLGPVKDDWVWSVKEVAFNIRVVSFAILIVPIMSLIRGFFQGHESMGPSAVSQVVEQILRIGFGLIAAFIIVVLLDGSKSLAVAMVTFGAFVGALGGLAVLLNYWYKRKPHLDQMVKQSTGRDDTPLSTVYRELIGYAIPFVAVGLSMQLYIQIDLLMVNYFMIDYGVMNKSELNEFIANYTLYDQKIIMIPVSLATGLAMSAVPAITSSFAKGDQELVKGKITQALQFIIFLVVPAVTGIILLGDHLYVLLFGHEGNSQIGTMILKWYAPSALLFALFSVTASILQGLNKQKITVISLIIGILLKVILNPLFIKWFGMVGPILSTDAGYLAAVSLNLYAIHRRARYQYAFIAKRFLLISIFSGLMGLGVSLIAMMAGAPQNWLEAAFVSLGGAAVGVLIYLFLALRSGLATQVFGRRLPLVSRWMR